MSEELKANLGEIPMDKLEEWAKKFPRFVEVTTDANWNQNAYELAMKGLQERGCPDELVNGYITKEFSNKTIQQNLLVIFARASVQGHFDHKTEETFASETIANEEWLTWATGEAVRWFANATVDAFNEINLTAAIASIFFDEEDDEDGEVQ